MSDLIRREDAIKALHDEWDECLVVDESGEYIADICENVIDTIPSADRPQEWIPCSERLPEEEQMVLTTIRGHDVIIPQEGETIEQAIKRIWNEVCYVSVGFIGSDGWYGADGYPQMVRPIAWMPLPKPWKGVDDE